MSNATMGNPRAIESNAARGVSSTSGVAIVAFAQGDSQLLQIDRESTLGRNLPSSRRYAGACTATM
jgi:hypothetical protein